MNKIAFAVKIWNVYRTQQYKTNPLILKKKKKRDLDNLNLV